MAIQQQGPRAIGFFGTRNMGFMHQQLIEVLSYAMVITVCLPTSILIMHNFSLEFSYLWIFNTCNPLPEKSYFYIRSFWDQRCCYKGCFKGRKTWSPYCNLASELKEAATWEPRIAIKSKIWDIFFYVSVLNLSEAKKQVSLLKAPKLKRKLLE